MELTELIELSGLDGGRCRIRDKCLSQSLISQEEEIFGREKIDAGCF